MIKVLIIAPMAPFVVEEVVRLSSVLEVHLELPPDFRYSRYYDYLKDLLKKTSSSIYVSHAPYIDLRALLHATSFLRFYPIHALMRDPLLIYSEIRRTNNCLNIIRFHDVDIIHSHFAYQEGFIGYLIKNLLERKKFVVTLHGNDILIEPSIGYGIRLDKRYDIVVRKVLEKADAIIVASKAVYEEAKKLVNDYKKLYLVPNGVDLQKFNPSIDGSMIRKLYDTEDKYIVFTLRHHEPQYGIVYLILAASIVLRHRKDVIFIIGGDGSLRNYHINLAKRLGIENYVFFPGRIPRTDVPMYYAASDIVVVPSLQEAWGLVATEAMACGKPVIASRVGGLPDQIIDGFNGFLVPPRDPKAIADRILYLLENPSEMKRMGLNGRGLAEKEFDIEKRVDRLVRLYKTLLRG